MIQNIMSALLGALVGGVAAGFGAYVSFSKIIAILETKLKNVEKDCVTCKAGFETRIFRLESARMKGEFD